MVDSRDLTVMTAWDPPDAEMTNSEKEYSFKERQVDLVMKDLQIYGFGQVST